MDLAARLTEMDRRLLLLLVRLPFAPVQTLHQALGLDDGSYVYRRLRSLQNAGVVGVLRPALRDGPTPQVFYLTELGLAVVGVDRQVEPRSLARRLGVGQADLLNRLPSLPHLLDCYQLLGAVAAPRPGQPTLLAWQRPWRERFYRPTAKTPLTVRVPAYAALAWDEACAEYLLIPDRGMLPVQAHRHLLAQLLLLRQAQDGDLPHLVVATTHSGQVGMWERLLRETSDRRLDTPLAASITTWTDVPEGLELPASDEPSPVKPVHLIQSIDVEPLRERAPGRRISRHASEPLTATSPPQPCDHLGQRALTLAPTDRALLDVIGRHPFLTADDIAAVMDWNTRWARYQRRRLLDLGLVRLVAADEIGAEASARGLTELTQDGVALLAAGQGLSPAGAMRGAGLVGGGPQPAAPVRRKLLQTLDHTLGVNGVFVSLYRTARQRRTRGHDDAVLEWRSPVLCSNRLIRPDGYAVYCRDGAPFGFFLEYDRGTMKLRQYYAKFSAYYTYLEQGLFERHYDGMPTVLVVTTDIAAEKRVLRAARVVSVGREIDLPLMVTCEWRVRDSRNSDGLLGSIWGRCERVQAGSSRGLSVPPPSQGPHGSTHRSHDRGC